jgi:hypothetical protein
MSGGRLEGMKDIHKSVKEVLWQNFQGVALFTQIWFLRARERAIYGVYILLDASFQPKLLEIILKYVLGQFFYIHLQYEEH